MIPENFADPVDHGQNFSRTRLRCFEFESEQIADDDQKANLVTVDRGEAWQEMTRTAPRKCVTSPEDPVARSEKSSFSLLAKGDSPLCQAGSVKSMGSNQLFRGEVIRMGSLSSCSRVSHVAFLSNFQRWLHGPIRPYQTSPNLCVVLRTKA